MRKEIRFTDELWQTKFGERIEKMRWALTGDCYRKRPKHFLYATRLRPIRDVQDYGLLHPYEKSCCYEQI